MDCKGVGREKETWGKRRKKIWKRVGMLNGKKIKRRRKDKEENESTKFEEMWEKERDERERKIEESRYNEI